MAWFGARMSNTVRRLETQWMAAAVGCSALGMAFHTIREFGYAGLWSLGIRGSRIARMRRMTQMFRGNSWHSSIREIRV